MSSTRRTFLGASLGAVAGFGAAPAFAACAPAQAYNGATISHGLKLSLAAYSFNRLLPRDGKKGSLNLEEFFELAASWGLGAVEPTSYYFESESQAYLYKIKAKAFQLGLAISGTAIGNNFALPPGSKRDEQYYLARRWIDHAQLIGAPVIRVFAGNKRKEADRDQDFAWAAEGMKVACDYAASKGVFLAIENHGYLTEGPEDVVRFLEEVNHPWFGVNLDTGNFDTAPYAGMEKLAPHALTVQVKVQVPGEHGREMADFDRIADILKAANYRGYLALEYECKEDPYAAVPKYLGMLRKAIA